MALTSSFYEAVKSENVTRVRIMMKDSLLIDPSFAQFDQMNQAASGMQGLYEEHDGRELNTDKSTWDDSYMNKLMVQVVSNFSHERVEHLKKVVRYLRSNPAVKTPQQTFSVPMDKNIRTGQAASNNHNTQKSQTAYQQQKGFDQQSGSYRGTTLATGAVIGAAAGAAVAVVADVTIVAGVAVGAAIGAGAATVVARGGKL